jgi:type IV secretion system protein VirB4
MATVRGIPHELCDAAQRNTSATLLNRIWRDLGDDNITICAHLVRSRAPDDYARPKFRNEFSRKLYDAWCEYVLRGRLFRNTWYVTLIVSPRGVPVGGKKLQKAVARWIYRFRQEADRQCADTSEIEGLWLQLERSLAAYSVERLGYRYNQTRFHRYRFSQIGEAMQRFLGIAGAVPITTGRLGNDIYTDADQPIFERRIYRILPPGCDDDSDDAEGVKWWALFGLNNYMEETGPDLLDKVLSLPMPVVVSHHFAFAAKPAAVAHLTRTRKQMKATKDAGTKERKGLKKAASQTQSGEEARGEHDCSIAVSGDTYSQLLRNAATASAVLVETGAKIVPETGANLAQYFGQLPGNFQYCAHPGKIGSSDFVNFANFGCFPAGSKEGKWGPAMVRFPTTAMTAYDFVPHVGNVGMTAVFGLTDSGKTVLLCFLMAMIDQYMVDNNGLIVLFDKDGGCQIFVESIGGNYLPIANRKDSGLAPLKGFKKDTPHARSCLVRLVRFLIEQDKLGPIPAEDNARIERGIAAVLQLPVEDRDFWFVRWFLGWDNPLGAGPRLERWCRGKSLGWLFDGVRDLVDFAAPAVAFDLGQILGDDEVLPAVVMYLMDRLEPVLDGRRVAGVFDEAGKTVASPHIEDRMEDFWRTWRKLNGMAWLATQEPEDLLRSAAGRAILDQCLSMISFPQPGCSHRTYCGDDNDPGLGYTEGEFEAVNSGMRPGAHQFLLKRRGLNAESVICNFDLSTLPEWFLHVLSGTANRNRLWQELKEDGPDAFEAFMVRSKEAVD